MLSPRDAIALASSLVSHHGHLDHHHQTGARASTYPTPRTHTVIFRHGRDNHRLAPLTLVCGIGTFGKSQSNPRISWRHAGAVDYLPHRRGLRDTLVGFGRLADGREYRGGRYSSTGINEGVGVR